MGVQKKGKKKKVKSGLLNNGIFSKMYLSRVAIHLGPALHAIDSSKYMAIIIVIISLTHGNCFN